MSVHSHSDHDERRHAAASSSRWMIVLFAFVLIAGLLLFTEHRAHVLGALIWLPLLLCPLMHLFMHGGHGGHGGHRSQADRSEGRAS